MGTCTNRTVVVRLLKDRVTPMAASINFHRTELDAHFLLSLLVPIPKCRNTEMLGNFFFRAEPITQTDPMSTLHHHHL